MLRVTFHWVHRALAWLILAALVVEFYLAGAPVFRATTFSSHVELGRTIGTSILLLFLLGLVDRSERHVVRLSAVLVGLMIVQWVLPALGPVVPWIAAFHVIVGMALIGVTFRIATALGTGVRLRRPLSVPTVDASKPHSAPVPTGHAS